MSSIRLLGGASVLGVWSLIACGPTPAAAIQSELDNNPRLSQAGIEVKVTEYKNGFLTLTVTKHSLGPNARAAIASGEALRDIYMGTTMDVAPLMQAEEVLKKRADIKDVIWKIAEPNRPVEPGPSNSTSSVPPPEEVVASPACPFEGCKLGRWAALEAISLYTAPNGTAMKEAVIKGQVVEALTGQVRATPRRATVTGTYKTDVEQGIRIGSVVHALYPLGEGAVAVWHEGRIKEGSLDLGLRYAEPASSLQWTWWVQIRLPDGTTGWLKSPQGKFDGMDAYS